MAESPSTLFKVHLADGAIIGCKNFHNGEESVTEDNGSGKTASGNDSLDIGEKTLVDTVVLINEEIEKNYHCEEILTGNCVDSSKTTGEIKITEEHCGDSVSNSDRAGEKFGEQTMIKNTIRKNCAESDGEKTVIDDSETGDEQIANDSDSGHIGSMAKYTGRSYDGENMTIEDCESDEEAFVKKTFVFFSKEISRKTVIENVAGTGKDGTVATQIDSFCSEGTAAKSDASGNKLTVGIEGKYSKGKTVARNISMLNSGTTVTNISDYDSKETGTMSGAFGKTGTLNRAFHDDEFCRKDPASPIMVSVGCSEGTGCLPGTVENIDEHTPSTKKQDQAPQPPCTIEDKRKRILDMMKELQQQHLSEALADFSILAEDGIDQLNICRICHNVGEEVLITPCRCIGSAQYVHASCLLTWFRESVKDTCELCQQKVKVDKKVKSLSQWRLPQQKPFPVMWFLIFVIGLLLNAFSLIFNGSDECESTTCLVFYGINGFGLMLDLVFMIFWWSSCLAYFKKWWALNQEWTLINNPHVTVISQATSNDREEDGHNEMQTV